MRSIILVTSIIIMSSCRPIQQADSVVMATGDQEGSVQKKSFRSKFMGDRDWGFNIYLPPGYNQGAQRYPVIYSLHGGGGNEDGMTWTVNNHIKGYIQNKQIPPVIMVFPNGGPDTFYLDNNVIRGQNNNPDSYLVRELIPYIDANYRTIPEARARAITGFSMGGYGAYHFAFKYPDLFGATAPCAAGGPYGPGGLITNYSAADKPHSLAVSNAAKLRSQRIFIAVGGNDLVPYNNELVNILKSQNIPHQYEVLPGVGHDIGAIMSRTGLKMFQHITADFAAAIAAQQPKPESLQNKPTAAPSEQQPAKPAPTPSQQPSPNPTQPSKPEAPKPLPPKPAAPVPPKPAAPQADADATEPEEDLLLPNAEPSPVSNDYQFSAKTTSDWGAGYCLNITVKKTGNGSGSWTYNRPAEGKINQSWNSVLSDNGKSWSFTGVSFNKNLRTGESADFGFCANR